MIVLVLSATADVVNHQVTYMMTSQVSLLLPAISPCTLQLFRNLPNTEIRSKILLEPDVAGLTKNVWMPVLPESGRDPVNP